MALAGRRCSSHRRRGRSGPRSCKRRRSSTIWKPRKCRIFFVVNKMDRPGADFQATLDALQTRVRAARRRRTVAARFGRECSADTSISRIWKAATFRRHRRKSIAQLPATRPRTALTPRARGTARSDGRLRRSPDGRIAGRRRAARSKRSNAISAIECSHDQIVPGARRGRCDRAPAWPRCVNAIEQWFPSPAQAPQAWTPKAARSPPDPAGPVVAQVIKTSIHPQSGKLSIVRVLSGTIKADRNAHQRHQGGDKVRSGGLYRLQGKKQEAIAEAARRMRSSRSRASNRCDGRHAHRATVIKFCCRACPSTTRSSPLPSSRKTAWTKRRFRRCSRASSTKILRCVWSAPT